MNKIIIIFLLFGVGLILGCSNTPENTASQITDPVAQYGCNSLPNTKTIAAGEDKMVFTPVVANGDSTGHWQTLIILGRQLANNDVQCSSLVPYVDVEFAAFGDETVSLIDQEGRMTFYKRSFFDDENPNSIEVIKDMWTRRGVKLFQPQVVKSMDSETTITAEDTAVDLINANGQLTRKPLPKSLTQLEWVTALDAGNLLIIAQRADDGKDQLGVLNVKNNSFKTLDTPLTDSNWTLPVAALDRKGHYLIISYKGRLNLFEYPALRPLYNTVVGITSKVNLTDLRSLTQVAVSADGKLIAFSYGDKDVSVLRSQMDPTNHMTTFSTWDNQSVVGIKFLEDDRTIEVTSSKGTKTLYTVH